MTVTNHPMSALKGTDRARQMMGQVRAHRGGAQPAPPSKPTPERPAMTGSTPHFIKNAIKRPGALTAKAKAAGQTVDQYAQAHAHDPGVAGDEARFYLNVLKKTGKPAGPTRPARPPDEVAFVRAGRGG